MPYIKEEARDLMSESMSGARTPSELNWLFTTILDGYLRVNGLNCQHINDVLGALEGAKLEFYRRVVVPYENVKLAENGDVYTGADNV